MRLLLMALAGSLGTLARYGLSIGANRWATVAMGGFPLGTTLVNILGSFILGFVATISLHWISDDDLRLVIGTGFLGAFTTFSTFELETQRLIADRNWPHLAAYLAGNLLVGFAAILLGRAIALRVLPSG